MNNQARAKPNATEHLNAKGELHHPSVVRVNARFFSKTSADPSHNVQPELKSDEELDIRRKVYLSTLDRDDTTDRLIAHFKSDYEPNDVAFIPYRYSHLSTRQAKNYFFYQVLNLLTDPNANMVFHVCKILPALSQHVTIENKNDMHRMLTSIRNQNGVHFLIHAMIDEIMPQLAKPLFDIANQKPEAAAPTLHL